jgi:hypothetical protein
MSKRMISVDWNQLSLPVQIKIAAMTDSEDAMDAILEEKSVLSNLAHDTYKVFENPIFYQDRFLEKILPYITKYEHLLRRISGNFYRISQDQTKNISREMITKLYGMLVKHPDPLERSRVGCLYRLKNTPPWLNSLLYTAYQNYLPANRK